MPAKFGVRLAGHLLIGCLLSLAAPSRALADPPGLRWVDNYEQGLVEATRQARPVFVYFDAAWCSWCQQYKQGTLLDPGVRELLGRHYVTVLVDFDARPDLAQRYRVRGLPYTPDPLRARRMAERFCGHTYRRRHA